MPYANKETETNRMAKVLKALSHPNRLELYLEITRENEACYKTGGECFVADIIDSLNIGAPTVSHHLKELANAGLITTEKRGKYLVAKINEETLMEVNSVFAFKP